MSLVEEWKKISVAECLTCFFKWNHIKNCEEEKEIPGGKKSVNSLVIQQRKKDGRFGFLGEKIKK